jgi:hypothetical protein
MFKPLVHGVMLGCRSLQVPKRELVQSHVALAPLTSLCPSICIFLGDSFGSCVLGSLFLAGGPFLPSLSVNTFLGQANPASTLFWVLGIMLRLRLHGEPLWCSSARL